MTARRSFQRVAGDRALAREPGARQRLALALFDNVKSVSNMMSAREWRSGRAFWCALVFWVWLASFVFGFAASDLLHTANCPEQLALRAAHNREMAPNATHSAAPDAAHEAAATSQLSVWHAFHVDASCPTCLLQVGAQGILGVAMPLSVPLLVAAFFARSHYSHRIARARMIGARGPPARFI